MMKFAEEFKVDSNTNEIIEEIGNDGSQHILLEAMRASKKGMILSLCQIIRPFLYANLQMATQVFLLFPTVSNFKH